MTASFRESGSGNGSRPWCLPPFIESEPDLLAPYGGMMQPHPEARRGQGNSQLGIRNEERLFHRHRLRWQGPPEPPPPERRPEYPGKAATCWKRSASFRDRAHHGSTVMEAAELPVHPGDLAIGIASHIGDIPQGFCVMRDQFFPKAFPILSRVATQSKKMAALGCAPCKPARAARAAVRAASVVDSSVEVMMRMVAPSGTSAAQRMDPSRHLQRHP